MNLVKKKGLSFDSKQPLFCIFLLKSRDSLCKTSFWTTFVFHTFDDSEQKGQNRDLKSILKHFYQMSSFLFVYLPNHKKGRKRK